MSAPEEDEEQRLYARLVQILKLPGKLDELIIALKLDTGYLTEGSPPARLSRLIIDQLKLREPPELDRLPPLLGLGAKKVAATPAKKCILFLAANAIPGMPLELDREVGIIRENLARDEPGREYILEPVGATAAMELSEYLLKFRPQIVHFSGHGRASGDIVLFGDSGGGVPVDPSAIARLFAALPVKPQCIVLNACYSGALADQLSAHVDCVVGMSRAIGDDAAIRFSEGFYRGIAHGQNPRVSFDLGCAQIDLAGLPDAVVPHFKTRSADETPIPERRSYSAGPGDMRGGEPEIPKLYPLWFGTNRRPIDRLKPGLGFGREDDKQLHYGTCRVAVPKSHQIGSVGSPFWKRLLTCTDDRLKLVDLECQAAEDFWEGVRKALNEWEADRKTGVIFIHGFNVSFDDAACRAAQIGFDLQVPGVMGFYSWPSKGKFGVGEYMADEATIDGSELHLTEFLSRFIADSGADRLHVIAHSMGNRGLLRSMQRILAKAGDSAVVPFEHVILAAPDVDERLFCDLATGATRLARRTTLYASSKDRALASSGLLHDHQRAGYTPPVTVLRPIDTVEVSKVDLTFLGHGYFAAARDLLHDIHALINNDQPPDGRMGLTRQVNEAGEPYWIIGA